MRLPIRLFLRRRSLWALTSRWVLAVSAVAVIAGCGTVSDGQGEKAASSSAGGAAEILAVQGAPRASLRHRGNGDLYELSMERPSPTLYFADSPSREVQKAPARHFPGWIEMGTAAQGYAPNVTLSWDATRGPSSVVAELRGVKYERGRDRIRATLAPLGQRPGVPALTTSQSHLTGFSNRPATMVVDGFLGARRCWSTVNVPYRTVWARTGSSIEGSWMRSPPESIGFTETPIGSQTDEEFHGCEFTASYEDGEGNGFTVGVDNPEVGSASYTCRGSGSAVCEIVESFERSEEEALLQVQIYYNR